MNPIVVLLVMAVLILVGSALASSTEAAMLTVNPIQVHTLKQQKVPGSRALERIKARPGRALVLLVVINNLFNISGSILLGSQANQVFESVGGRWALLLFNVGFTVAVILFAEILPKTIGNSFAMPISLVSARILLMLERLTLPLLLVLEKLMPAITATSELTTNEREIHLMARLVSPAGPDRSRRGRDDRQGLCPQRPHRQGSDGFTGGDPVPFRRRQPGLGSPGDP